MPKKSKQVKIHLRRHRITVLLDKILIFRFMRSLHGRFWGLAFIAIVVAGLSVCFLIYPELLHWSTALSDFGNDVRTAPYFAGTVFFAAYALWRWRNYLARTLKRSRPLIGLLSCTIIGLYLIALMPLSWKPWPFRIHIAGVILVGVSIALTVVVDTSLSKTRKNQQTWQWRFMRFLSFLCICCGGYITFGSLDAVRWYDATLLGELLMIGGYSIWIIVKTYQGETNRSYLAKQLKNLVLID